VRVFHWSLVGLFALAYFTGDEDDEIHVWAGYAILVLIASRIVWGFIGSKHARFSDFVRSPSVVFRYLKSVVSRSAPRTLGHNPAGGWMVLLLLVSILATGGSGLVVLGLEGEGPMAGHIAANGWIVAVGSALGGGEGSENDEHKEGREHEDDRAADQNQASMSTNQAFESAEDAWEEIHEFLANFTVLLVVLHIAGVIFSSIADRENLVRAMFTGLKKEE
jgi:cytochrome b